MKLAFYAPLKAPDHPVPSGDRTMARNLLAALSSTGAQVTLASRFRSRDGTGDPQLQSALIAEAEALLPDLIAAGRAAGWQAWITYHNYYKAPDLLGPAAALALGIPYLQIESTRARKRLGGPWDAFAKRAEAASDAAAVILYLTSRDAEALERDAPAHQHVLHLAPFLNADTLPDKAQGKGTILVVGMMRDGDKLASYRIIAETLALLPDDGWSMQIVGDGPARDKVVRMMAPFGTNVTFRGELDAADLADAYRKATVFFWPGVNEAFGLVYLEAQGAGLPVIAQDRPGVRDVLAAGHYPTPSDGPGALAQELSRALSDPADLSRRADAARAHVSAQHLLPAARAALQNALVQAGVTP